MRVGVYVDGFNLYFGARAICGGDVPGWRWLDLHALSSSLIPLAWLARAARVERVVYCTARLSGAADPSSPAEQDVYLRALRSHRSVDHVEFGAFVSRVKIAPLAEKGSDVNVATHLLTDAIEGSVDAAIVITNDSDLELPLRVVRERIPVGTVNPGPKPLAGKLKGTPQDGVGDHWWARVTAVAYRSHQLPARVGRLRKPDGW